MKDAVKHLASEGVDVIATFGGLIAHAAAQAEVPGHHNHVSFISLVGAVPKPPPIRGDSSAVVICRAGKKTSPA